MLGLFLIDLSGSLLPVLSASTLKDWDVGSHSGMYTCTQLFLETWLMESEFMERGASCKSDNYNKYHNNLEPLLKAPRPRRSPWKQGLAVIANSELCLVNIR